MCDHVIFVVSFILNVLSDETAFIEFSEQSKTHSDFNPIPICVRKMPTASNVMMGNKTINIGKRQLSDLLAKSHSFRLPEKTEFHLETGNISFRDRFDFVSCLFIHTGIDFFGSLEKKNKTGWFKVKYGNTCTCH